MQRVNSATDWHTNKVTEWQVIFKYNDRPVFARLEVGKIELT